MADGQTYLEALSYVQTIIQEWIDTARDVDRPVPEPEGKLMYA